MLRFRDVLVLVFLGISVSIASAATATEQGFDWKHVDGKSVALVGPNGPIWRFNYSPDQTKPFFNPVGLVTGELLTWNRPSDHDWHHALWFSWFTINGVDYWQHDPDTGRPKGKTSWQLPRIETDNESGVTRITMLLNYAPTDGEPVLQETRIVTISLPSEEGEYHFDWDATFRALGDEVLIDRLPIPPHPDGVPWGGFAGLSLRLAEDLKDRHAVTEKAKAEFDAGGIYRSPARACAYQGVVNDKPAGMTIFHHPGNPQSRSAFYVIKSNMSYLNPAFLQDDDFTITADQPLRLRYRVAVHPSHRTPQQLQKLADDYQQQDAAATKARVK